MSRIRELMGEAGCALPGNLFEDVVSFADAMATPKRKAE